MRLTCRPLLQRALLLLQLPHFGVHELAALAQQLLHPQHRLDAPRRVLAALPTSRSRRAVSAATACRRNTSTTSTFSAGDAGVSCRRPAPDPLPASPAPALPLPLPLCLCLRLSLLYKPPVRAPAMPGLASGPEVPQAPPSLSLPSPILWSAPTGLPATAAWARPEEPRAGEREAPDLPTALPAPGAQGPCRKGPGLAARLHAAGPASGGPVVVGDLLDRRGTGGRGRTRCAVGYCPG